ncbi:alginate lyase [Cryptococcus wingfieldii CBS 7118]|uniref:Alginate lyase n=1 Tax=Cryptococcus wingfieldii CBS 7118 TaxID=1295528 RepID=A0A1E3J3X7_9TREE|nr:alginate lyase [Cryptococcus wingfieldii CBS 7118]ODN94816.1 alginate lyase [Cryptococcus wingfieldii CBS 7118]
MFTSLIALLPLLALPLSHAAGASDPRELDSRAIYDADAALAPRGTDAPVNAHGHGANGFRSRAHTSGVRRRRNHGEAGQKLVRRKVNGGKENKEKRTSEKKKRSCKAKTSEAASSSTASSSASLASAASSAVSSGSSSATAASSAASLTNYASSAASSIATGTASASTNDTGDNWTASVSFQTTYTVGNNATATATATATSSQVANATASAYESELFPWGTGLASWTTSDGLLSYDSALKPLTSGKLADTTNAPDGTSALYASYPSGTYGLSSDTGSGFSFYSPGYSGVEIDNATEVMLSYSIWFDSGFQFNKGGKLPGLYGGTSLSAAKSCSGGRQNDRGDCFSARLMWRTNGAGEIYDYLPVSYTDSDSGYGESIDRGAFTWATGEWVTVANRVKLNDVGSANGEQEITINGESKISITGVTFATKDNTKIYGIMAQTFFGGHDSDWASPQDQKAYFKDWSIAVLA